jgi:hypothetical protein
MIFLFCFLIFLTRSQTSTSIGLYTNSYQYGCNPSQGMVFDTDQITHPNIIKTYNPIPGSDAFVSIFTVLISTLYKVTITYSSDSSNNGVSVISGPDVDSLIETNYCVTTRHSLTTGMGVFIVNASSSNWIIVAACAMSNPFNSQIQFPDARVPSMQVPMSSVLIESVI